MKLILLYFFIIFSSLAEEMIIEVSAKYKLETFTYPDNSTYSFYKGEGSWTNSLGDYGHIKCLGPIEKKANYFKLDHICEYINQDNEKMWHSVNREGNQDADAGAGRSIVFNGTGKYKKFIGAQCPYAIRYLDDKNFSKHKCNKVSD